MDAREQRRDRRDRVAQRAAERDAAGRNAPALVRWRRARRRIGSWCIAVCAPLLLRMLSCTWRVQRVGEPGLSLLRSDRPWLVAMWHGRMLGLMPLRWHRGRDIQVLVSPSDDGGLAQQALRAFRYRIVRGSLSRGGASALRAMHGLLATGGQLVVTPDGPRGPRHGMNSGVAWLARASGIPILPVGLAVDRAWRLRSWDRFTIPKPFARLCVVYGEPVAVAPGAGDEELERIGERVRAALLAAERAGFARLGIGDDLQVPR